MLVMLMVKVGTTRKNDILFVCVFIWINVEMVGGRKESFTTYPPARRNANEQPTRLGTHVGLN